MAIIDNADAYTMKRVSVGVKEGRATLRLVPVKDGYRLGGQTGQHGEAIILFSDVMAYAQAVETGVKQFGRIPKRTVV
jgi:hypothetical protein